MLHKPPYDKRKLASPCNNAPRGNAMRSSFALKNNDDRTKYINILNQARADWDALREFRRRTERTRKYVDGMQWDDLTICPKTKKPITEYALLRRQGVTPLVQNIMSAMVNNIMGQYRSNSDKTIVQIRDADKRDRELMMSDMLADNDGKRFKFYTTYHCCGLFMVCTAKNPTNF
jgi:hypothetical protein